MHSHLKKFMIHVLCAHTWKLVNDQKKTQEKKEVLGKCMNGVLKPSKEKVKYLLETQTLLEYKLGILITF